MQKIKIGRYDDYVDSGVEWLGAIPSCWEVKKLKYISILYNGDSLNEKQKKQYESTNNLEHPYISSKDINIVDSKIDYNNGLRIPNVDYKFKIAPSRSSLLCIEGGSAGRKIAFTKYDVCFVNKLACINVLKGNSSKYIYYSLKSQIFQFQFNTSITGLIGGVAISSINNFIIHIPPIEEQTEIVNFLDNKCEKIDKAIVQKQKLIALLKERKQILIQNAVTKGVDPNVELVDSGIEWIGKIPSHWKVKRAKYLFYEVDDRSVSGKEELLSVSHMTGVTPRADKNVSMFMSESYVGSKLCNKDDLIYNVMWTWMGALGSSDREGIVSPSYAVYRQISPLFNLKFIEELFISKKYIEYYNRKSTGLHSSRLRFYSHMFFNMEVSFPNRMEQDKIVLFIETISNKIDKAISLQERQIEKLKEYKATLINSAVTGKIKVY